MAQRSCPACGAPLQFSSQKFCTKCGSTVPEVTPAAAPAAAGPGVLVAVVVIAGILVLGAGAFLIYPHIAGTVGSSSQGMAGSGENIPSGQPPAATTAAPVTTVTTPLPVTTASPLPTPKPTTIPATVQKTTAPPATTLPTPIPTQATTVPTAIPEPEATSVIKLDVTYAPEQPPVSSYTSSTAGAPYIEPSSLEMRIHELVNAQRVQNGLSELSYDPFLADIARGHSWDMVQRNYFEHETPERVNARGRGDAAGYPCIRVIGRYTYSGISENLFQGHRADSYYTNAEGEVTSYVWSSQEEIAQRGVNGWMASEGHRKNILTSHFSYEGIGVAFSSDDKIYVTQNFC